VNGPTKPIVLKDKPDGITKSGPSNKDQWTVVNRSKKTPKSRIPIVDNSQHWTNSFQLLGKVDGFKHNDSEIRKSNEALLRLLDEEEDPGPSCALDKGKGQLVDEVEDGLRGFSPHS